jgi:hypothetical protein
MPFASCQGRALKPRSSRLGAGIVLNWPLTSSLTARSVNPHIEITLAQRPSWVIHVGSDLSAFGNIADMSS